MSKRKSKLDDWEWFQRKLLAQDLASKTPEMQEYAGLDQKSALLVARINALIEIIPVLYPDMKSLIPLLEVKKKVVIHEGRANWVSNATELTNLGLLVPKETFVMDITKEMEKRKQEKEE
ncbi:MAG: hypothetical protein OEY47_01310 [Candidatus Bathyarchaeota archaeon]|nr:hypothetical protein [Candidatus Bathyarchaeota archaeon]